MWGCSRGGRKGVERDRGGLCGCVCGGGGGGESNTLIFRMHIPK